MKETTGRHLWLYCTVFVTGGAIMVIELLGTRIIAPFYGSSLYVWTSVIAVTLMALAVGYFLGGYLADHARRIGLSPVVAAAGVLTMLIPWFAQPVLLATDSLGLRLGSFTSTFVLFTPSLMVLGMISPFAVKLATDSLDGVGLNTGSIYAVSTVGSVIGTLLLGFFLFPEIGTRQIFLAVGVLLLLVAVAAYFVERKFRLQHFSPIPLMALISIGLIFTLSVGNNTSETDSNYITRFEQESLYGWVRVIDNPRGNFRVLAMDSSIIGAASLNTGQNALTYQRVVGLLPDLRKGMERALLIGQGAGHMAMQLSSMGVTTDTIELDPAISFAATEFFGYEPSGETLIGDARYETKRLTHKYDLIILDVFTGGAEPFHLLTREYLSELQALLQEGGLVAVNFVGFYDAGNNPALASVSVTLEQVFATQRAFVSEPGIDFNDYVFLASDAPIETDRASPVNADWFATHSVAINQSGGLLLTDNLNPLEKLQIRKSEYYRQVVTGLIGIERLLR